MKVDNIAAWTIAGFAAFSIISVGAYAEFRDKRYRRDIILHGEPAMATIVAMKPNSGRNTSWDVRVEFQAIDQTDLTRVEFRIRVRAQLASWGDWKSLLSQPESLDDFAVGQLVQIHYPKKWPGLAVLDARPNAIRVG
jgi:hypothetical protein